jgi:hypothetical protein
VTSPAGFRAAGSLARLCSAKARGVTSTILTSAKDYPMSDSRATALDHGTLPTHWAADFADAAYVVLLGSGTCGSWIDLRLDVWRALAGSINKCAEQKSLALGDPDDVQPWREALVAEVSDAIYRTALRRGLRRSFLDVEVGLFRALRRVVERFPARHPATPELWRKRPGWRRV